jgi:hemolysin activation/secretion protein
VGAGARGRLTSHGDVEDGLVDVSARYYHRNSDARLFFVSVTGAAAANLDPDHQLLLGGDNGLRGYPLRYALGDKSVLLTLEERFYVRREFFHLLRIGGAVFADVGKAWSEAPIPAAHLGVLKDVGVGLRFGQTRSAHAAVVRVDVAVPFDAMGSGLHPQILVTTGETF